MQRGIKQIINLQSSRGQSSKLSQLCEQLINTDGYNFFHSLILKAQQFSNVCSNWNRKSKWLDKIDQDKVNAIFYILDREMKRFIEASKYSKEQSFLQTWKVFSALLNSTKLEMYQFRQCILPSLSVFLSNCNQLELRYIIKDYENNSNQNEQLILAEGLFKSGANPNVIIQFAHNMFYRFSEQFSSSLNMLIQRLQVMESYDNAVEMVCCEVKRWTRYCQQLRNFITERNTLENVQMINSVQLIKLINTITKIDKILNIQHSSEQVEYEQQKKLSLIFSCRFSQFNHSINGLKTMVFKLLNSILSKIIYKKYQLKYFNNFLKMFNSQFYQQIILDICIISRHQLHLSISGLNQERLSLFQELYKLLELSLSISNLKNTLFMAIQEVMGMQEFLLFGCIFGIRQFQSNIYQEDRHYNFNFGKKKISQGKNNFVSKFMCKINTALNDQYQFLLQFCSQIACYLIEPDGQDLFQILSKYHIQQDLSAYIQHKNIKNYNNDELSLFLYITSCLTEKQLFLSNNVLMLIELGQKIFFDLRRAEKFHLMNILMNVSRYSLTGKVKQIVRKFLTNMTDTLFEQYQEQKLQLIAQFSVQMIEQTSKVLADRKNMDSGQRECYNEFLSTLFQSVLDKYGRSKDYELKDALVAIIEMPQWNMLQSTFQQKLSVIEHCIRDIQELFDHKPEYNEYRTPQQDEEQSIALMQIVIDNIGFDRDSTSFSARKQQVNKRLTYFLQILSSSIGNLSQSHTQAICSIIDVVTQHYVKVQQKQPHHSFNKQNLTIQMITKYLLSCQYPIEQQYFSSVYNILIICDGQIDQNLIKTAIKNIRNKPQTQTQTLKQYHLKQILELLNVIAFYQRVHKMSYEGWEKICELVLLQVRETTKIKDGEFKKRSSITMNKTQVLHSIRLQLEALKLTIFLLSYHANNNNINITNKLIHSIHTQINLANELLSFEPCLTFTDVTMIAFAIEPYLEFMQNNERKELLLRLGLLLSQKKIRQDIWPQFILKHYCPFVAIRSYLHEILDYSEKQNRLHNDEKNQKQNLGIKMLLKEMASMTIVQNEERKIFKISIKNQTSICSKKNDVANEDVII